MKTVYYYPIIWLMKIMVKLSKSKNGQYRITMNPQIVSLFGMSESKEYEWVSIQGLPALREKK
jgi:hypothetical protein